MKTSNRRLEVLRRHRRQQMAKTALALIVGGSLLFGFIKFEAWFNRDYYAHRCAGYGYEADCVTPLKGGATK